MKAYSSPALKAHGSLTALTLGNDTSGDVDGVSGMFGNSSMSDTGGGGDNGGRP